MPSFIQRTTAVNANTSSGSMALSVHDQAITGDSQVLAHSTHSTIDPPDPTGSGWSVLLNLTNVHSRLKIWTRVLQAADVNVAVSITSVEFRRAEMRTYRGASGIALAGSGQGLVSPARPVDGILCRFGGAARPNTTEGEMSNPKTFTPDPALLNTDGVRTYQWYDGLVSGDDPAAEGTIAPARTATITGGTATQYPQFADVMVLSPEIIVIGEPWAATLQADEGEVRVPIVVNGESFSVTATAADGAATNNVIVPGQRFSVSVAANDGSGAIDPSADLVDFDTYTGDTYRYFVFDILTDNLLAELNFSDVSFSTKLGTVGEFSGSISTAKVDQSIDVYWATMPAKTALYILRDEKAVWGGVIWNRSYDAASRSLSVSAGTWESYLYRRHVWHTYKTPNDWDQYEVVRQFTRHLRRDFENIYTEEDNVNPKPSSSEVDIFVRSQPEYSGIAQEEITYKRENMQNFGDVLTDFADNVNGFEWQFEYAYNKLSQRFRRRIRLLKTPPHLLPKGAPRPQDNENDKPGVDTFIFDYPGNIVTLSLDEDGDNACTRQFVVGGLGEAGEGLDTDYKPIGSWNNNRALNLGFPLIENVESSRHNDVSKMGRLNNLAAIYGRQATPPVRKWSITVSGDKDPIVGTYRVGDWCRVMIDDPFIKKSLDLAGTAYENGIVKRIVGYTVSVPTGPQLPELVTLDLDDDFFIGLDEEQPVTE